MCMACEEEALWRRYLLEVAVREGVIPPGFEPEDFEIEGLPVPPRRAAPPDSEIPSSAHSRERGNPDSSNSETLAPTPRLRGDERTESAPVARSIGKSANNFVCDAPDDK